MIIYENIRLALFSLKANKMRSLLTMLGIIIGIASVIAIMTVGDAVTSSVSSSMEDIGANNIEVSIWLTDEAAERDTTPEETEEDRYTLEMIETYCNAYPDSIQAISATESVGSGQIIDGKLYANISLTGVSGGYFDANNMTMLKGRTFSTKELEEGRKVALISDKAVDNLFGGNLDKALGSEIQISINSKYYNFTVAGIYEYDQSMMMMMGATSSKDMVTNCLIPLKTAKSMTHVEGYESFTVVTKRGIDADTFVTTTEDFFKKYYENNKDYEPYIYSMASLVDSLSEMMSTLTTAIAAIAAIALLVGGIGVMNIMLVSITERTREIGTRKALGAPNSSIRMQFIIEAIVICIVGGLIGIILGSALGIFLANLVNVPATPSVDSIILSLSFSMAIGIFFGYYPANKAAKMDPIEALRYE